MQKNINSKSLFITKGDIMPQARFDIDEYTARVLDVIKGKYGLKNRNDALKKFILEFGDNYIEPEISETDLKQLKKESEKHYKKYGYRTMSIKELDNL